MTRCTTLSDATETTILWLWAVERDWRARGYGFPAWYQHPTEGWFAEITAGKKGIRVHQRRKCAILARILDGTHEELLAWSRARENGRISADPAAPSTIDVAAGRVVGADVADKVVSTLGMQWREHALACENVVKKRNTQIADLTHLLTRARVAVAALSRAGDGHPGNEAVNVLLIDIDNALLPGPPDPSALRTGIA